MLRATGTGLLAAWLLLSLAASQCVACPLLFSAKSKPSAHHSCCGKCKGKPSGTKQQTEDCPRDKTVAENAEPARPAPVQLAVAASLAAVGPEYVIPASGDEADPLPVCDYSPPDPCLLHSALLL